MGPQACDSCFRITFNECLETLTLSAQLEADTDYKVYVRKESINDYNQLDVTSNGDGEIDIDLTDAVFGTGYFNKDAGLFTVWVTTADDSTPAVLVFDNVEYYCVKMDFVKCEPTTTTYTIE